jgi:hypothetical protein
MAWMRRQWDDIKGNVKYGILASLWWIAVEVGRHMLQYIPNIHPWMIWTILLTASLLAFVLVTRSMRTVPATQQSQAPQPSSLAVVPGIPTLSSLLGQEAKPDFDAKQFFARAHYSTVTAEVEKNIKTIAHKVSPADPEAFYARFIGIGLVAYWHDSTWFTIYGSQLKLLEELNGKNAPSPISVAQKYYDQAKEKYPPTYANYSFDQWLGYMKSRLIIVRYPSEMIEITHHGKDFLKYLTHWGFKVVKAN